MNIKLARLSMTQRDYEIYFISFYKMAVMTYKIIQQVYLCPPPLSSKFVLYLTLSSIIPWHRMFCPGAWMVITANVILINKNVFYTDISRAVNQVESWKAIVCIGEFFNSSCAQELQL